MSAPAASPALQKEVTAFLQSIVDDEQQLWKTLHPENAGGKPLPAEQKQALVKAHLSKFYEPDAVMIRPTGNPLTLDHYAGMFSSGLVKGFSNELLQGGVENVKALDGGAGGASVTVVSCTARYHQKFLYDNSPNDDLATVTHVLKRSGPNSTGPWKIAHGQRARGQDANTAGKSLEEDPLQPMRPPAEQSGDQRVCAEHILQCFGAWGAGHFNEKNEVGYQTYAKFWASKAEVDGVLAREQRAGAQAGPIGKIVAEIKSKSGASKDVYGCYNDMSAFSAGLSEKHRQTSNSGKMFACAATQEAVMDYWVWWNKEFEQDPASMQVQFACGPEKSGKMFMHMQSDIKSKVTGKVAEQVPLMFECQQITVVPEGRDAVPYQKILGFRVFASGEATAAMQAILA